MNCNTCCDTNGKCVPAPGPLQCGAGGGACKACNANQLCKAGSCQAKPPKAYSLVAVRANVPKYCGKLLFINIDKCDPFVHVTLGSYAEKSGVKKGEKHPEWNDTLFSAPPAAFLGTQMLIKVWDGDSFLFFDDDKIGTCVHQVTQQELTAGKFVVPSCGDADNVTFKLVPVP